MNIKELIAEADKETQAIIKKGYVDKLVNVNLQLQQAKRLAYNCAKQVEKQIVSVDEELAGIEKMFPDDKSKEG